MNSIIYILLSLVGLLAITRAEVVNEFSSRSWKDLGEALFDAEKSPSTREGFSALLNHLNNILGLESQSGAKELKEKVEELIKMGKVVRWRCHKNFFTALNSLADRYENKNAKLGDYLKEIEGEQFKLCEETWFEDFASIVFKADRKYVDKAGELHEIFRGAPIPTLDKLGCLSCKQESEEEIEKRFSKGFLKFIESQSGQALSLKASRKGSVGKKCKEVVDQICSKYVSSFKDHFEVFDIMMDKELVDTIVDKKYLRWLEAFRLCRYAVQLNYERLGANIHTLLVEREQKGSEQ